MVKNRFKMMTLGILLALVFSSAPFSKVTPATANETSVANCFPFASSATELCRDWWGGGDGDTGGGSSAFFWANTQNIISNNYCSMAPIDMACVERFLRLPVGQFGQTNFIRFQVAVPACNLAQGNPICIREVSLDFGEGYQKLSATRSFYGKSFPGAPLLGIPAGGVHSVWTRDGWKVGEAEYGVRGTLAYEARWDPIKSRIETRKVKSDFGITRYAASTDPSDPAWNFGSRRIPLDAKAVEMKFSLPKDFGGWMLANMVDSKIGRESQADAADYTISGTVSDMGLIKGPASLGSQMQRDWPTDFEAISSSTKNEYYALNKEWRFVIFQSDDECVLGNAGISGLVSHNAPYVNPGNGPSFFNSYLPKFNYDFLTFDFASLSKRPDGSPISTHVELNLDPKYISCKFGLSNSLVDVTFEESTTKTMQSQISNLNGWVTFKNVSSGGVLSYEVSARDAKTSDLSLSLQPGPGTKLSAKQSLDFSNFIAKTTKAKSYTCTASGASSKVKVALLKASNSICSRSKLSNTGAQISVVWSSKKAKFSNIVVRANF